MATDTYDWRSNPNVFDNERFRPYLYTDNLLGEDVTLEILSLLEGLSDQHRGIKKSIDVLNITLESLRRSYDDIEGMIYSYKSLLSPIRRLPDDVLGEIFLHTLPSTRNAFPIHSEFPLLLTLVSKRWRSIAQATSRLWSKLHIVIPRSQIAGEEEVLHRRSYISAVKTWLYRSGEAPLSLSIASSNPRWCTDDTSPLAEELLLFVIQQSPRWGEVELVCGSEVMRSINKIMALNSGERPLPPLRRLRVHYMTSPQDSEDSTAFYRYSARNLKALSFDFYSVPPTSSLFPMLHESVDWLSLTQLSLHRCVVGSSWSFGILQQCQQLEALLLDISGHDPEQTRDLICIPKLKVFSLRGGNNDDTNICRDLETPLLTHFSFYPTYHMYEAFDQDRPPSSPLCDFLARCGRLQSLTLCPAKIPDHDILSILEAVPGIQSLILDHSDSPLMWVNEEHKFPHQYPAADFPLKSFLLQGSVTSQSPTASSPSLSPFLPNLQSLSLLCLSTHPEDAESIISFCKSRLPQPFLGDATADADPPFVSLNYIKMTLSKLDSTPNIGDQLHQHAGSVGRIIGDDLVLDITYPWGAEDLWIPPTVLDPRKGLNDETNRTWYNIEAEDLKY